MAEMDQIGAAAGLGGIDVAELFHVEAEIVGHRHHPARRVAGAEIAVDVGLGEASILDRALGDFGMQL